jgi:uncharacterized protein YndB with AHSA1/START domain
MSTTSETTAVRLQIEVDVPQEHAFRVFTEQFGQIKPRDHNLLAVDIAETVFETHVGGQLYDRGVDGSECRWGRVLVFEPPARFVVTWDISPRWELDEDPEHSSEVEVTFTAQGPESTIVELEHRNLDRHGAGWQDLRDQVAADGGWPLYLQRFKDAATRA